MKSATRFLLALALLAAGSLRAGAQTVVTAPEAPFEFTPLEMFVFPAKDFPITKYGAKPGNVTATTQAFAKAMAALAAARP